MPRRLRQTRGKLHVFPLDSTGLTLSIHGARVRQLPKLIELRVHGKERACMRVVVHSHGDLVVLTRDAACLFLAVDQRRVAFAPNVLQLHRGSCTATATAFLTRARRRADQGL